MRLPAGTRMTHPYEDTLLRSIEDRRDDLVELTRALIRIPSVNPPGDHYRECAELLGERLRGRGFEVTYWQADEQGRWRRRD